jgi:hypothetical protein
MIKYEGKLDSFGLEFCSGGEESQYRNFIRLGSYYFSIPAIIKPKEYKMHSPAGNYSYYARREYGFYVFDGHVMIKWGDQPDYFGEIKNNNYKSFFLPWTQYTFRHHKIFDLNHNELAVEYGKHIDRDCKIYSRLPKVTFILEDYDGEEIEATCYIEERMWTKGEKWCSWLKYFTKPIVRRNIDIEFNKETGPKKGSWKGGIIGTSEEIAPNEAPIEAIRRYCSKHNMIYKGVK